MDKKRDLGINLEESTVLAIKLTPTMDHEVYKIYYRVNNEIKLTYGQLKFLDPIWIKFSLKGAKEAIAKLGQELNE